MAKQKFKDPRGGHVRIYWEVLDSHAWLALSWADQGLYMASRRKLQSFNNGNIEATLGTLRHHGITSSATLAKGLRALQAVGLLEMTRQGGVAAGGKVCSLYRFTDEPVLDHPKQGIKKMAATNEWKRFRTHGEAEVAVKDAHFAALRPETKNKRKVQSLNAISSPSELSREVLSSVSEITEGARLQELNTRRVVSTVLEPA